MLYDDATIVARASAQGNARRGIVRLSGADVLSAVAPLFFKRGPETELSPERNAETETFVPVAPSELVPDVGKTAIVSGRLAPWGTESPRRTVECALFYWPKERGFTGEQAIELHLPGAPPILDATVRSICATGFARLAQRGEFTLRAFLSGRIDLTQAEAVLGAIDATSDRALQTALTQLAGKLSAKFSVLRDNLFDVLSDLEANFDFSEEDIQFVTSKQIRAQIVETSARVAEALAEARSQGSLDVLPRVVLVGKPNAGKSSLFNRFSQRFGVDAPSPALVSDVAGTTRDYLVSELCVDGVRFALIDAAGVESALALAPQTKTPKPDSSTAFDATPQDSPRELAQRGLKELFAGAALILHCREAANVRENAEPFRAERAAWSLSANIPAIDVATKRDFIVGDRKFERDETANSVDAETLVPIPSQPIETSAKTGFGIDELARRVAAELRAQTENGEIVPSTAIRCQESLRETNDALGRALELLDAGFDDVLVASEIRLALDRLGLITGRTHTEDLLDRIFGKFCVGK